MQPTTTTTKSVILLQKVIDAALGGVILVVSMYFSALPRKVYSEYNFAFPIQIEEINGNSVSGLHFGIHSMSDTSIWKCLQTHWHRQDPRKGCPPTRIKPSTTTNSQKTLPASTSLVSITTASCRSVHEKKMPSLRMALVQFWATQPKREVSCKVGFTALKQDVTGDTYKATTLHLSLLPQAALLRAEPAEDTAWNSVTSLQTTVTYRISRLPVLRPHQ